MEKNYQGEQWKPVIFDFDFVNTTTVEVSNFGRIKTYNKVSNGNIIRGSMVNGYRIIRLKFFTAREEKVKKRFEYLQKQVFQLALKMKELKLVHGKQKKKDNAHATKTGEISSNDLLLKKLKESLSKKFKEDLKSRTIYYQALIHRLVAEYFIEQPSPEHIIVAHSDHDKLNNHKSNLKWMKPEENYLHQSFSPKVIANRTYSNGRRKEDAKSTKLSVTKVMLLKKLINERKPMKQLVKQFKVTETQILRIKRGENWAEVQAAP